MWRKEESSSSEREKSLKQHSACNRGHPLNHSHHCYKDQLLYICRILATKSLVCVCGNVYIFLFVSEKKICWIIDFLVNSLLSTLIHDLVVFCLPLFSMGSQWLVGWLVPYICHFSLADFSVIVFQMFTMMSLSVNLFIFILCGICWIFWYVFNVLSLNSGRCWPFFSIIFFCPFLCF